MIKRVDKRLQAVQCLTGNKIKIIACITMLIDHFSKIFLESIMNDKLFPLYLAGGMSTEQFYGIDAFQKNILNGIGTIAFPLFCLLLSEGFFYIPVATEQTRGLSTRVSMKQALKQQGFTGVGQKQTEWKAWMDREKEVLTEIAQQHEFEIISLGSNRRHMELPEYRAAIQESEAVQEQTAAALQELADMQEKKTELKGEIKSLSGTVAALKAAERVRVDFDTIQPEKTLTGAVKGVTVEQIQQLKKVAMTGAAAKQAVVELKKKNAALEKENAEMQKKIPSTMDQLLEKKNLELLETRNFNLRQENKELKEALEEERSFSDRLLESIDRVLDMLERHLPKQLLHLVDKARDLLPEHQTYRQEKQHERGHSWGDMSL